MTSDLAQTKALRLHKTQEKKQIKSLNDTGKRLAWIREKLELSQSEVCLATGIPKSSYCGRESGLRPELIEEFLVLAQFFNKLWQQRFNGSYPHLEGEEVKKITTCFLMFGFDDIEANSQAIIEEYQIRLQEIESDYFNREAELLRQLDMFAREEE